MSPWTIVAFVLSLVGVIIGIIMMVFVTFKLPSILELERDNHPPGTNFAPVNIASTENVNLAVRPYPKIDEMELKSGQRVLLKDQTNSRENGIWIVPRTMDEQWKRARDMSIGKQLVDGATVFVTNGVNNRDNTFVLRILSRTQHTKPGETDLYFIPILQHLFGPAQLPSNQVLQVNDRGLATWNTQDLVAKHMLEIMDKRGLIDKSIRPTVYLPEKIHTIYGMWEDTVIPEEWERNIESWKARNKGFQIRVWNPDQCEELVRAEFTHLTDLYTTLHPVMKLNLLRWLILYHEGGYFLDCDVFLKEGTNFQTLWKSMGQPRMMLAVESMISEHECESINRFEIRKHDPCTPGPRISTFFVASCTHHPFIHFIIDHIRDHQRLEHSYDYEIVYASGTDAITSLYRKYGKDFEDMHVLKCEHVNEIMDHRRSSTWKKVKNVNT